MNNDLSREYLKKNFSQIKIKYVVWNKCCLSAGENKPQYTANPPGSCSLMGRWDEREKVRKSCRSTNKGKSEKREQMTCRTRF